jgi:hypothetical protein
MHRCRLGFIESEVALKPSESVVAPRPDFEKASPDLICSARPQMPSTWAVDSVLVEVLSYVAHTLQVRKRTIKERQCLGDPLSLPVCRECERSSLPHPPENDDQELNI